jgi:hypothetical protein
MVPAVSPLCPVGGVLSAPGGHSAGRGKFACDGLYSMVINAMAINAMAPTMTGGEIHEALCN